MLGNVGRLRFGTADCEVFPSSFLLLLLLPTFFSFLQVHSILSRMLSYEGGVGFDAREHGGYKFCTSGQRLIEWLKERQTDWSAQLIGEFLDFLFKRAVLRDAYGDVDVFYPKHYYYFYAPVRHRYIFM